MQKRYTLGENIHRLARPHLVEANITDERGAIQRVHQGEHPALIDLLENGTGTSRGTSRNHLGPRYIGDDTALELWGEIRDQLRAWGRELKAPWFDELTIDLECWYEHHKAAVARGRVTGEAEADIARTVDRWARTIEAKYDPDRIIEFTAPCPAIFRRYDENGGLTGQHACDRTRVTVAGIERAAVTINLTRGEAKCLACGTKWEGERALRSLVWAAEQREREVLAATDPGPAVAPRELVSTGPIDLP